MKLTTRNLGRMMILLTLSACKVSVNNTGDIGSNNGRRGSSGGGGECALWDIVGHYEDNVEITADCRLKVGQTDTLVIDDPDTNEPRFFNRQIVWGNWAETQEVEQCWIQLVDEELFVDCWEWEYRGFKEQD